MVCTSVYIDHVVQQNLDSCDVLNSACNVCMYKGAWGVVGCDHVGTSQPCFNLYLLDDIIGF